MKWFWLSAILSLLTVGVFAGSVDDCAFMVWAVKHQCVVSQMYAQSYGWCFYLKVLSFFLGHHYLAYRFVVMGIGLIAYYLFVYVARKSSLAILGLSSLLWAPTTYESLRSLRYDAINLLLLSIQVCWLKSESGALPSYIAGFLAGLGPLADLPAGLILIAMLFFVAWSWKRIAQIIPWLAGVYCGGLLAIRFYPWDDFVEQRLASLRFLSKVGLNRWNNPGILMISHPLWLFKRPFLFSDIAIAHHSYLAVMFYWVFMGMCLLRMNKSVLARFAVCFLAAHVLFSMSQYDVLIFPLAILGSLC